MASSTSTRAAVAPGENAQRRATDVSARLQHLRNLLNSERYGSEEMRRARETLDHELAQSVNRRREERRRAEESTGAGQSNTLPGYHQLEGQATALSAQANVINAVSATNPSPNFPSYLSRSRRRILRPTERLLRHRERSQSHPPIAEPMATPPSTLASEQPPPSTGPTTIDNEHRWRSKRRKLEDGTFEDESQTFSYDDKGSVMEGSLRMEMVSCDGGEYTESSGTSLPEHALQDDTSVYCTKSNRCNMLLKHVGGMPFSLTRLTVKAPDDGYDAPIQEGMIFVSLDDGKLLEKTSQYEIRYSPRSYRQRQQQLDTRDGRYWRPSDEYLRYNRSPLRSIDRSLYAGRALPEVSNDGLDKEDPFLETSLVPGFKVTTTYDADHEAAPQGQVERPSWHAYVSDDFDPRRLMRAHRNLGDHYRPSYGSPPPLQPQMPFSRRYRPAPAAEDDRNHDDRHEDGEGGQSGEEVGSSVASEDNIDIDHERRHLDTDSLPDTEEDEVMARFHEYGQRRRQAAEERRARWLSTGSYAYDGRPTSRGYPSTDPRRIPQRRETPSRIELRRAQSLDRQQAGVFREPPALQLQTTSTSVKAQTATNQPVSKTEQTLAPHARFFIRRDKSAVHIHFDPPV